MSAVAPIPAPHSDAEAFVGVSGGRDSVALLHALVEGGWSKLTVCHLDHALRAESEEDARFVAELAERHGLAAIVEREDVAARAARERQSIETAARAARHAFFARIMRSRGEATLFLAHHAEDQVETFLFRLCRGSGAGGLQAMQCETMLEVEGVRMRIVRPFLAVWRAEIDEYVAQHRLAFREDSSNTDLHHTRNRLRHQVLPALEAAFGRDVRPAIWRAAEIVRAENEVFSDMAELSDPPPAVLAAADLRRMALAIQRRLLHRWLRVQGVPEVGFEAVESVRSLLVEPAVAKVNLPAGWHARRRAGQLFLERP